MKEQLENYSNLILDIKDDEELIFTCVDMVEFAKQYATEQLRLHGVSQQRELLLFRKWQEENWKNVYLYEDKFMVDTYLSEK